MVTWRSEEDTSQQGSNWVSSTQRRKIENMKLEHLSYSTPYYTLQPVSMEKREPILTMTMEIKQKKILTIWMERKKTMFLSVNRFEQGSMLQSSIQMK